MDLLQQSSLSYSTLSEFQILSKSLDPTELTSIQSTYKLIVDSFEGNIFLILQFSLKAFDFFLLFLINIFFIF